MNARLLFLLVALQGAVAMAIEQPTYVVKQQFKDFEVREYAAYVVAETEVTGAQTEVGSEAFSRLGGYIFGNNAAKKTIAMTSPVTQAPVSTTTWKVQFMMPKDAAPSLPAPTDARVKFRTMAARTVAVVRYSGTWSQENYDSNLKLLRAGMEREHLTPSGEPTWARYDPPYKPWFMRTNEILIEVQAPQDASVHSQADR